MADDAERSNGQWLRDQTETFDEVAALNRAIMDQNAQSAGFDAMDDEQDITPALLQEARGFLADDQLTDFRRLMELQRAVPYDALMIRHERTMHWLAELAIQLETIETEAVPEAEKLRHDAEVLSEYAPRIAERLQDVTDQQVALLLENRRGSILSERAAAQSVAGKLAGALSLVGVMAIPYLLTSEQRREAAGLEEASSPVDESDKIVIDEFPVEPGVLTNEELAEQVRKRYHGYLPQASEFLALILAEEHERPFTLFELGEFVYGKDSDPENVGRSSGASHVAALISNYRTRKIKVISRVLEEQGLVLQRGQRRFVSRDTGEQVGHAYALYRAIEPNRVGKAETFVRNGPHVTLIEDEWATL